MKTYVQLPLPNLTRVVPPVMCDKTLLGMRHWGMYPWAYTRFRLRLRDRVSRPRISRSRTPLPAHTPPPLRLPARAKS